MATITIQVSASADDCKIYDTGFTNTSAYFSAGNDPNGRSQSSAARFVNVQIPKGATITSAYLKLYGKSSNADGSTLTKISAEATDNATQITDYNDFVNRPRTTAKVDWDIPADGFTVGTWHTSPDISSVIQEVVNRSGWESGNAINIFWEDDGTPADTNDRIADATSYDDDPSLAPKLEVTYSVAYSKELSETLLLSDYVTKASSIIRVESLSLSDVVTALRVKVKELVESIGLSDFISKAPSVIKSETLSLTDIYSRTLSLYRTLSETLSLSDRVSKLVGLVKSEALSLTDYLEKRFVILKILTETLGLSDTLARIRIKKTLARIRGVTRILNAIREKPAERELGR